MATENKKINIKKYIDDFMNRQAGNLWLGIIIIIAYLGLKLRHGFQLSAIWYGAWFSAIIFAALAADLFERTDSWIYTSLRNIECSQLSNEDKLIMIKTEIEVLVEKHLSIFLMTNGFDKTLERLQINFKKVYKGIITVKELIIIIAYAFYDLVITPGKLNDLEPSGFIVIVFLVIVKITDATRGAGSIIAMMFKELNLSKTAQAQMDKISSLIKLLAQKFGIVYEEYQKECEEIKDSTTEVNKIE